MICGTAGSSSCCVTFWIIFILLVVQTNCVRVFDELHIGGIFPIAGKGGWQGGQACMPAARLALEDVNNKNDLLPGFKLTLHSNDSEVSVTYISFLFSNFLFVFHPTFHLIKGLFAKVRLEWL